MIYKHWARFIFSFYWLTPTCIPQKEAAQVKLWDPAEKIGRKYIFLYYSKRSLSKVKTTVKLSFLCSALLTDRLSHQWQAFHENIIRDNETKEYLRDRSSYLGKECMCAGSQRCQRQIDSLCSLSAIVCPCLCVCLSVATFFHLTCFNTFPQRCLFHVLFSFIVCSCTADFYQVQTRFSNRRLFLLCFLTRYLNDDFQPVGPVCLCEYV